LPDVELVQGEDALNLKNRFTNFAECDVGRDALKEDVCGASDYSVMQGENENDRSVKLSSTCDSGGK
jgi:hypothetical protein